MEIRTLRYFLAVAREENMTRAAELLHVTQPTLSRALKSLEDELGKKLFIRHSFRIELTEEGVLLRDRAEDLVLMGKSGLGKTYLMHCMARRLLERGRSVLMVSAYRFLEAARKAVFSRDSAELNSLIDADVLMLDDLGSEALVRNVTIETLFTLVNERQRAGRGMVISTNLSESEFRERYTERIASRLFDGQKCRLVPFYGADLRRRRTQ